jgi:hypothetical protein
VTIPARPTVYRGIQMRSRLEAGFAAWLDRRQFTWGYEPRCFATATRQYLPDFVIPHAILGPASGAFPEPVTPPDVLRSVYIEVRPWLDLVEATRLTRVVQASEDAHLLYASPDQVWCGQGRTLAVELVLDGEEDRAMIFDCTECGGTTIADSVQSWCCRRCGAYDGDRYLRPVTDLPWADTPLAADLRVGTPGPYHRPALGAYRQ